MKKTTLLAGLALILATATVNAQTEPEKQTPATQTPVTTTQTPVATQTPATTQTTAQTTASKDKYNNWSADTYKMQPMPEALTTEKIFPVIGRYQLTDKEGAASNISIALDESNKGLVWIDGFPQGRIKANLRKSPAVYQIPAQKIGEGKEAVAVSEGVLIYDKDANTMNVCFGCTYKAEDPNSAFVAPVEPVVEETPAKTTKSKSKTSTAKVKKVKEVRYSGSKVIEESATIQQ